MHIFYDSNLKINMKLPEEKKNTMENNEKGSKELAELLEALKELIEIAENYQIQIDKPGWKLEFIRINALIDRAKKLIK